MIVREARTTDAVAIAQAQVDSWRTTYAGILPADYLASLSYERQGEFWGRIVSTLRSTDTVYVAEAPEGKIVGFAYGGPERSGAGTYKGELYAIYLLKSYQR